jgi:hypothetical protein
MVGKRARRNSRAMGDVQIDAVVAAGLHLAVDGPGHHIAGGQIPAASYLCMKMAAVPVDQTAALAAHRLGDQKIFGLGMDRGRWDETGQTPGWPPWPRPGKPWRYRRRWRCRGWWYRGRPCRSRRCRAPTGCPTWASTLSSRKGPPQCPPGQDLSRYRHSAFLVTSVTWANAATFSAKDSPATPLPITSTSASEHFPSQKSYNVSRETLKNSSPSAKSIVYFFPNAATKEGGP